jgi:hypothetical protein
MAAERVVGVFRDADVDKSGTLEIDELAMILQKLEPAESWSAAVVRDLVVGMGLSGDDVQYEEFVKCVFFGRAVLPQPADAPVVAGSGARRLTPSSVYVRIRPIDSDGRSGHVDGEAVSKKLARWDEKSVTVQDDDRREDTTFGVTRVIPPDLQQEATFDTIAPHLLEAFTTDGNVMCKPRNSEIHEFLNF